MKKATKIIKDIDGAIKIPVYLSWGDIAFLQTAIRKSKLNHSFTLNQELRYREAEIVAYLDAEKSVIKVRA